MRAPCRSSGTSPGVRCDDERLVALALEVAQDLEDGVRHPVHVGKVGLGEQCDSHTSRVTGAERADAAQRRRHRREFTGCTAPPVTGRVAVSSAVHRRLVPRRCDRRAARRGRGRARGRCRCCSSSSLGDAFLVVVPGETAVTAFARAGGVDGQPAARRRRRCRRARRRSPATPSATSSAAPSVSSGGAGCAAAARRRRSRGHARGSSEAPRAIVFTARFIPFARLAVNLTAGASRHPRAALPRDRARRRARLGGLPVAASARSSRGSSRAARSSRRSLISIAVALALGLALDAILARRRGARRRRSRRRGMMGR